MTRKNILVMCSNPGTKYTVMLKAWKWDYIFLLEALSNSCVTQYVWTLVNFIHYLRCLMKNLRNQQKIYANAGRTGCDKYDLWARRWKLHYTTKSHANRSADSHSLLGLVKTILPMKKTEESRSVAVGGPLSRRTYSPARASLVEVVWSSPSSADQQS